MPPLTRFAVRSASNVRTVLEPAAPLAIRGTLSAPTVITGSPEVAGALVVVFRTALGLTGTPVTRRRP